MPMARTIVVILVGTIVLLLTLLWRAHQHARNLQARVMALKQGTLRPWYER